MYSYKTCIISTPTPTTTTTTTRNGIAIANDIIMLLQHFDFR